MTNVVGIYGGIIESNSPCGKCKEYYEEFKGAFEDFLETNDLSYLDKLKEIDTGIRETRKELGSKLLDAISVGCESCNNLELLLDVSFLELIKSYVEEVEIFKEEGFAENEFAEFMQRCYRDLYELKEAQEYKKYVNKNKDGLKLISVV